MGVSHEKTTDRRVRCDGVGTYGVVVPHAWAYAGPIARLVFCP